MVSLENLDHLPGRKRRELEYVVKIVFEEFDNHQKTKLSDKRRAGRILKLILYGSYARGDWVEDRGSGYRSDYDLLAVVNTPDFAEANEIWIQIDERLTKELVVTGHLQTPAQVIAHSLADINDQLARGMPFFIDIARDGIVLYEESGHPLVEPKPLTPEAERLEAQSYYEQWFSNASTFAKGVIFYLNEGDLKHSAFLAHQAVESLYHCALLVLSLYSPKLHRLSKLRSPAERIAPPLIAAWPRDTKFARRCFSKLERAYVDARYSPHYEITREELDWLVERIKVLQGMVKDVCEAHLKSV